MSDDQHQGEIHNVTLADFYSSWPVAAAQQMAIIATECEPK
jgi:hypothetical protein